MSEQMDKFIQDKLDNLTPLEKEVLELRIKVHQLQSHYAALEAACQPFADLIEQLHPNDTNNTHRKVFVNVGDVRKLAALLAATEERK